MTSSQLEPVSIFEIDVIHLDLIRIVMLYQGRRY